jgi:hypothetical protein
MFEYFLRAIEARRKVELTVMKPYVQVLWVAEAADTGRDAAEASAGSKRKRQA